jgi:hypothetical protein
VRLHLQPGFLIPGKSKLHVQQPTALVRDDHEGDSHRDDSDSDDSGSDCNDDRRR